MNQLSILMAKLAGIRQALTDVMEENVSTSLNRGEVRTRTSFHPELCAHYFSQAGGHIDKLKALLPDLYEDFQSIDIEPSVKMVSTSNGPIPNHFSRAQIERLMRDIDQVFEIRANSELEQPKRQASQCVFISHGHSNDWRVVQPFIEKDIGLPTIELAQEPNLGRTIIEKLIDNADRCDSAVIVMTGDDIAREDERRVRENVMHEIGFFQGRYGRTMVVLLHEEGVNVPTNLSGVAYIPFPKGKIDAGFHVLQRELNALYKR